MITKYPHSLLWLIAIACCGLPGCGSSTPAQIAPQIKETIEPIAFLQDHETGMKIARQERKPTLAFFSFPENSSSQRMLKTTFRDDEIKRLADWLVCIQVDGRQDHALCESLEISNFPTIILSNANGVEVCRLVGWQTPDQLAVQIHVLLQSSVLRPQTVATK